MAGGAADALVHVDAVVEVDEVGQIVDAVHSIERPVRKLSRTGSRNGLLAKICEWQFMHVLRRRNAGERRILDRGVAVAAVDAVAGDVALVAELNRLLARDVRASVIHGERFTSAKRPSRPAMKKTAPKMLTRAIVFALR